MTRDEAEFLYMLGQLSGACYAAMLYFGWKLVSAMWALLKQHLAPKNRPATYTKQLGYDKR